MQGEFVSHYQKQFFSDETRLRSKAKLVVVGDANCGKSCLLIAQAERKFPQQYVEDVVEEYTTRVDLPEASAELVLCVTRGQIDYDAIRRLQYDEADVFLICCDVSNRDSLDNVQVRWKPEIEKTESPFFIVGCKGELRANGQADYSLEDAKALASSLGARGYLECSAKENVGVDEVFREASKIAFKHLKIVSHFQMKRKRMETKKYKTDGLASKRARGGRLKQLACLKSFEEGEPVRFAVRTPP